MMRTPLPEVIRGLLAHLHALKQPEPFSFLPEAAPTGSRVICDPPVRTTDEDWIVWVPEGLGGEASVFLQEKGARFSEEQITYPDGVVYWIGDLNIIVVFDRAMYERWIVVTWWAKQFNIQSKALRKRFFNDLVDQVVVIDMLKL